MIQYNKISPTISQVTFDGELVGYVELIGDMYSIEVYYMTLNLNKSESRLIKGTIERIVKKHKAREYRELVKKRNLRYSIMYGKKYTKFFVLDGDETEQELFDMGCNFTKPG